MPWATRSTMSVRHEFVLLAHHENANMRALCQRFGISPTTGYKWLARYGTEGPSGLHDRSRRPHTCPQRTPTALEQAILQVRDAHPAWGGRKIRARLHVLQPGDIPSPSTITTILQRSGRLHPAEAAKHTAWQRFEHDAPNRLWQMDFKGHFALDQGRCHPLTVLDDHSRFAMGLQACADQQGQTVKTRLTGIFRRYGLPERMTMDNGSPWGSDPEHPYTPLTVWLIRLGIQVSHSAPYHPQTQGKDERFHRTLQAELLHTRFFRDLHHCQTHFNRWRDVYNLERPHQALAMAVPASRYHESPRAFPETLPSLDYSPQDIVRKVQAQGIISYRNHIFKISKAFRGWPVALRPTNHDGLLDVFFCQQKVGQINLRSPQ
jgi:transposase InsO family protein